MKKSILYTFAIAVFLLTGCDDMLDKSPRDQLSNTPVFWNNSNNVESYSNRFYTNYIGFSQNGGAGWFYFMSLSDDQVSPTFDNWDYVTVPATTSDWTGKG